MPDLITQPTNQQPKENAPDQVRVFSMPATYRHGAVVSVVEPQKAVPKPTTAVLPPVPPKPIAPIPPKAAPVLTQPSHTKKGLLIAIGIVVIAMGIGGYLLWRSAQKNTEAKLAAAQATAQAEAAAAAEAQAQAAALAAQVAAELAQGTPIGTEITPATPGTPGASPFAPAVTPGVDSDSDGLTDVEETIVYGTNPALPDSDADGFLDGNEVFHGYNPNGTSPGTLVEALLAQLMKVDGFQMLYPTKWTVLPDPTGAGSIVSASTGEAITISFSAKDPSLALSDWYTQNIKEGTPSVSKSKKGFPMLVAKNQSSAYVDLGNQVVSLIYDTSTKSTIDYLSTFQMMINSIELVK